MPRQRRTAAFQCLLALRKMKFLVRPELPTASVGSSQATTDAVDNSALAANRPQSTYKSGKVVQTSGATSLQRWDREVLTVQERVSLF